MFKWIERGPFPLPKTGQRQAYMLVAKLSRDGMPLPSINDIPAIIARPFFSDIAKTRREIERDKPVVEARYT